MSEVQQWEYRFVSINHTSRWLGIYKYIPRQELVDLFEGMGSLGWELAVTMPSDKHATFVFKRPKPQLP